MARLEWRLLLHHKLDCVNLSMQPYLHISLRLGCNTQSMHPRHYPVSVLQQLQVHQLFALSRLSSVVRLMLKQPPPAEQVRSLVAERRGVRSGMGRGTGRRVRV